MQSPELMEKNIFLHHAESSRAILYIMKKVSIDKFHDDLDLVMALQNDSQEAFTHIYNMN